MKFVFSLTSTGILWFAYILSISASRLSDSFWTGSRPSTDSGRDGSSRLSKLLTMFTDTDGLSSTLMNIEDLQHQRDVYRQLFKISPLFRQLFDDVVERSPLVRVIVSFSDGKFPSMRDLFGMFIGKTKSMASIITDVMAENRDWQRLTALMTKQDFGSSKEDYENFFRLMTGKSIDFRSSLTRDPKNRKFIAKSNAQARIKNLLEFSEFFSDNWNTFMSSFQLDKAQDVDYVTKLQNQIKSDYTHLARIVPSISSESPGKYTVSGHGIGVKQTDTDVTQVMKLVKDAETVVKQQDRNKAKVLDSRIFFKEMEILEHVLTGVLNTSGSSSGAEVPIAG